MGLRPILNYGWINFIAEQELLDTLHSNDKLNDLSNEHRKEPNWSLNDAKSCQNSKGL